MFDLPALRNFHAPNGMCRRRVSQIYERALRWSLSITGFHSGQNLTLANS